MSVHLRADVRRGLLFVISIESLVNIVEAYLLADHGRSVSAILERWITWKRNLELHLSLMET